MGKYRSRTQEIYLPSENTPISAYLAQPNAPGQFPGIVVLQEIFGVNPHIRDVTERIAQLGYTAIAPALFHRQAPDFSVGYTPADVELGRSYVQNTSTSQLLGDIQAAIDYLKTLPTVAPQFGCIGFCFGGHVAYLAATLPDIQVTASFYGRGINSFTFGGDEPSLSKTGSIAGTIYMFYGMDDRTISATDVAKVETALQEHQIKHRLWQYPGADHGFFCDRRATYNPTAAADAWLHVQELFASLGE
jgi:carboxymethylenebutenolidase